MLRSLGARAAVPKALGPGVQLQGSGVTVQEYRFWVQVLSPRVQAVRFRAQVHRSRVRCARYGLERAASGPRV